MPRRFFPPISTHYIIRKKQDYNLKQSINILNNYINKNLFPTRNLLSIQLLLGYANMCSDKIPGKHYPTQCKTSQATSKVSQEIMQTWIWRRVGGKGWPQYIDKWDARKTAEPWIVHMVSLFWIWIWIHSISWNGDYNCWNLNQLPGVRGENIGMINP